MSDDAAFAARVSRDVLRVTGPEAASYLHGQLSQDIEGLAVGDSAWTFALQPQGKVDAWFRATRVADDTFVLDVDGGWGDALARRLERFKLRVRCTIEPLPWQMVAVRGVLPDVDTLRATGAQLLVPLDWRELVGVDLLGPAVAIPESVDERDVSVYERWRVVAGMPKMGAELDEQTIPAEAGVVPQSVSFTKGCYTGQELVARIDSRGNKTPRKLRAVTLPAGVGGAAAVGPGDPLVVDGREVGVLTSVTGDRALAYVRREIDPPADATVRDIPARIEPL